MRMCSVRFAWPVLVTGFAWIGSSEVRAQSETSTATMTEQVADPAPVSNSVQAELAPAEQPASLTEAKAWYEALTVNAFVDAYFFWDFNQPPNVAPDDNNLDDTYTLNANPIHTFEAGRGFGLNQAGLNVIYPAQPAGGTISLRFGPGSEKFGGFSPIGKISLEMLKQAFVTWAPTSVLTLDFGRFDTIYGPEVTESYLNMNYSRGILWFNQPATHTGLRLAYAISPELSATLLAVNGWNNVIDNNDMKSFGAQFAYTMGSLKLILGTIFGPEQVDNNSTYRILVDLVATYSADALSLVFNADYLHEDTVNAGGAMLGVRVPLGDMFAAAARGELYYTDPGLAGDTSTIVTGTLTFDVIPASLLLIRAEGRFDYADSELFPTKSGDLKKFDVSALLSAVVKTN